MVNRGFLNLSVEYGEQDFTSRSIQRPDAAALEERLRADGVNGPLEPWDWRYYAEARRKEEHDLDEAELKPYLQLDRMIEAAFACAHRLFGLSFAPVEIPTNTMATLYVPACNAANVTESGRSLKSAPGVTFMKVKDGRVMLRVGSGTYQFFAKGRRQ